MTNERKLHIYLGQHELPIHAHGITDPAPSTDGKSIVIASKGWIWLLDIDSEIAKRITNSRYFDFRFIELVKVETFVS